MTNNKGTQRYNVLPEDKIVEESDEQVQTDTGKFVKLDFSKAGAMPFLDQDQDDYTD